MILAVIATEFESSYFIQEVNTDWFETLICGVGPVESALKLTRFLEKRAEDVSLIFHFGIGGAYIRKDELSCRMLDICIAEHEIFGDLGIHFPHRIDELPSEFFQKKFALDKYSAAMAEEILINRGISYRKGTFITVSSVSGTRSRGDIFVDQYDGLCENMEGAAIVRVAEEYHIPVLEIRCISNMVEDRNLQNWKMNQACLKMGKTAATVMDELSEKYEKI